MVLRVSDTFFNAAKSVQAGWPGGQTFLDFPYIWLWINTYKNTIFRGMNIHKSQLYWCELQGYYRFWHTAISFKFLYHLLMFFGPRCIWGLWPWLHMGHSNRDCAAIAASPSEAWLNTEVSSIKRQTVKTKTFAWSLHFAITVSFSSTHPVWSQGEWSYRHWVYPPRACLEWLSSCEAWNRNCTSIM
jgi:hypothetical protein